MDAHERVAASAATVTAAPLLAAAVASAKHWLSIDFCHFPYMELAQMSIDDWVDVLLNHRPKPASWCLCSIKTQLPVR